ncbi:MAG: EamA family transporter [Acidobacteria bacterium]|nr:EamA family transporter [Acidobacteriota bacterium]
MSALTALWASVVIGAFAQIALKSAVSGPLGGGNAAASSWWLTLLRSGWLWLYLSCFGAATGLWLLALSGLNISYAFPMLSASYVLVAVLARIFLKEAVSMRRWIAIGVICCGVILIARS